MIVLIVLFHNMFITLNVLLAPVHQNTIRKRLHHTKPVSVGIELKFINISVCPIGCATCTDSSNCQTCNSQYVLVDTLCETCPVGTYWNPDFTCSRRFFTEHKNIF